MNYSVAALPTAAAIEKTNSTRISCLDTARGIAIILVVVGHIVAREMPKDNDWFVIVKFLIYRFHMPFFMVLTGITFGMTLPAFSSWSAVWGYSRKKVIRLLVPYFVVGLFVLLGKFLAVQYVHVDHMPKDFGISLIRLLTAPAQSAVQFLWFIYVLSVYIAAVSVFVFAFGFRPFALLLFSLPLQLFSWPEDFLLNRIVIYLPYFAGGMLLSEYRNFWLKISVFWSVVANVVFICLLISSLFIKTPISLIAIASVPALLSLSNFIGGRVEEILGIIGRKSFSIYLMNNIFIGVVKAILLSFMAWDGAKFLIFCPLLFISGIVPPLVIKKYTAHYLPKVNNFI